MPLPASSPELTIRPHNDHVPPVNYTLSPEAIADGAGIADYTLNQWGAAQTTTYMIEMQAAIADWADGRKVGRTMRVNGHVVQRLTYRHHRICAVWAEDGMLRIIAILHARSRMGRVVSGRMEGIQ